MTEYIFSNNLGLMITILVWPGMVTALCLAYTGAWLKKPWLMILATVLSFPFTLAIAGYTAAGIFIPISLLCGAALVKTGKTVLAGVLLTFSFLITGWMLYAVLSQPEVTG